MKVTSNFINKQLKRKKMKINEVMRLGLRESQSVSTEVVLLFKLGRNEGFGELRHIIACLPVWKTTKLSQKEGMSKVDNIAKYNCYSILQRGCFCKIRTFDTPSINPERTFCLYRSGKTSFLPDFSNKTTSVATT
jgi:hypothetical protein